MYIIRVSTEHCYMTQDIYTYILYVSMYLFIFPYISTDLNQSMYKCISCMVIFMHILEYLILLIRISIKHFVPTKNYLPICVYIDLYIYILSMYR